MAVFVDSITFTAVMPILPIYKKEFDLSLPMIGVLVGAYSAFQLVVRMH